MAVITMGVVSEAKEARAALDGNSAAVGRIIEALQGAGIESRDLQTANFPSSPSIRSRLLATTALSHSSRR
jgi:uncharacterized protein YggE